MEYQATTAIDESVLCHYGMPRRSGRYPWGSGKDPYQHRSDFMTKVDSLKKEGYDENDIAQIMGYESSKELHYQLRLAKEEQTRENINYIEEMKARGQTYGQIAKDLGLSNESTVRSIINQKEDRLAKAQIKGTIELLKKYVDEHGMIDVGEGVEYHLGVSKDTLNTAIYALTGEGYKFFNSSMPNVTNKEGKKFVLSVFAAPDKEYKDAYDYDKIYHLDKAEEHSEDGGSTFHKLEYPSSLDSKRLQVVYAEDGGTNRDGLIEIRPGVKDLTLGKSNYAQVRILVDGDKYLKGMAVYADDLPPGVDVRFNSNKSKEFGIEGALKKAKKDDPNNPFGSAIKADGQNHYIGEDGQEHLGLINKTREEGEWSKYREGLSNQFLSKQSLGLIQQQLKISVDDYTKEFNDIQGLTNNALRKYYLNEFASTADKVSASLKASSIKGQAWKVILPDPNLKENEIYDPNYPNGTKLALVRYPHGAIFEIPEVIVNNKVKTSARMIGNGIDAVALNQKTADILSGADFDGDTVLTIPVGSGKTKIIREDRPSSLIGYDPKDKYSLPFSHDDDYCKKLETVWKMKKDGFKTQEIIDELGVTKEQMKQLSSDSKKVMRNTQTEMGKISNLIVDMTVKGAPQDEIVRAVKHSMTVIDAEKHRLDYKKSYEENGIKALKEKWQSREEYDPDTGEYVTRTGAGTILTRAHADVQTPKRVGSPKVDENGNLVWKTSGETYTDSKGREKLRTTTVKGIDLVSDAMALYGGGGDKELAYVDYSNAMKNMARVARLEATRVPNVKRNPQAAEKYSTEVASLNSKYELAMRNKPRERHAQQISNAQVIQAKRDAKKSGVKFDSDTIGKLANRTIMEAREDVGAYGKQYRIKITPKEWEAIQAGAISTSRFMQLLPKCDKDVLRSYAMPKKENSLTNGEIARIKAMLAGNYTLVEIAQAIGVSTSTVAKYK